MRDRLSTASDLLRSAGNKILLFVSSILAEPTEETTYPKGMMPCPGCGLIVDSIATRCPSCEAVLELGRPDLWR